MRIPVIVTVSLLLGAGVPAGAEQPAAPNGIRRYREYMNWKVIAPSYREDKGHIRVITGNGIAGKAAAGERYFPAKVNLSLF